MVEQNAPRDTPHGRYCLAVCYCGKCPHFKPMASSRVVPIKPKSDARQAKSWDTREEPTWIDKD
jgi:hypothetical protein